MKRTIPEIAIRAVANAFPVQAPLSPKMITVYGKNFKADEEASELVELFMNKEWPAVSREALQISCAALNFLSLDMKKYLLPAYLTDMCRVGSVVADDAWLILTTDWTWSLKLEAFSSVQRESIILAFLAMRSFECNTPVLIRAECCLELSTKSWYFMPSNSEELIGSLIATIDAIVDRECCVGRVIKSLEEDGVK